MTPFDQAKERGNIAYVLIGALAVSGSMVLLLERNTRSANEQALETASEVARGQNISALNMLKTLMSFPVANPSARDRAHVPAIFPDIYVNTGAPLAVRMRRIAPAQTPTSGNFWSVTDSGPNAGTITVNSLDPRFRAGASQGGGFFAAQAASLVPAPVPTPATALPTPNSTRILQVTPIYGRPPAKPASLITAYDVTVESTVPVSRRDPGKGTRKIATKARINVEAPPIPQCDITITDSAGRPLGPATRLRAGTRLFASMKTFGVALSARVFVPDGQGGRVWRPLTLTDEARSVRSTLNGGAEAWRTALSATSTGVEGADVVMKVTGEVTGVTGELTSCESSVRVDAGAKTSKQVGVNFEDRPHTGDRDYNDAVLCFKGGSEAAVSIDPLQVVSLEDQSIAPAVNFRSACTNTTMTISIVGPDDFHWSIGPFPANRPPAFKLPLRAGSRLHVFSNAGTCGDQAGNHGMYTPPWAMVESTCRTTGK